MLLRFRIPDDDPRAADLQSPGCVRAPEPFERRSRDAGLYLHATADERARSARTIDPVDRSVAEGEGSCDDVFLG
jgi:hypothetical protein